ncbi:hypothetical protein CH063_10059 [Colletotrichum higginsianum]|uniref:Uncharacterized protein n=1 Tax=Colletotrichum higginsianum (strain IMI 349063) TaxID=759273 RepID=H1VFZ3_COLHI|nr:hypothetical protein CH063_10059 [Colletotrichum higginsianum]
MRPRTSETQPSQAAAAPSNHHQGIASAPPPPDAHHDQHTQYHHHRESSQQQPHEPSSQGGANVGQPSFSSYHQTFPVIPSSYYHEPGSFAHDDYDDYEDYDDDTDEADDDDDDDLDMSDSDGGAPLDHIMSVTSLLSPMPVAEASNQTLTRNPYPGTLTASNPLIRHWSIMY